MEAELCPDHVHMLVEIPIKMALPGDSCFLHRIFISSGRILTPNLCEPRYD